jgi:hypothetical protein
MVKGAGLIEEVRVPKPALRSVKVAMDAGHVKKLAPDPMNLGFVYHRNLG